MTPYHRAQSALADLKAAIHDVLSASNEGLTNVQIGRTLGIYGGHSGKHEGHIPRVILEMMKEEGVVDQGEDKRWSLKRYF